MKFLALFFLCLSFSQSVWAIPCTTWVSDLRNWIFGGDISIQTMEAGTSVGEKIKKDTNLAMKLMKNEVLEAKKFDVNYLVTEKPLATLWVENEFLVVSNKGKEAYKIDISYKKLVFAQKDGDNVIVIVSDSYGYEGGLAASFNEGVTLDGLKADIYLLKADKFDHLTVKFPSKVENGEYPKLKVRRGDIGELILVNSESSEAVSVFTK
ncbi:MAG: hypothetical protein ACOYL6_16630 [Bacteriovoracaceae bacterium]